jgi:hypothetical protein
MIGTSDILFFDLEVHKKSKHILEIGALLRGDQLRKKSVESFVHFAGGASLLCGHNIIDHDLADPGTVSRLPGSVCKAGHRYAVLVSPPFSKEALSPIGEGLSPPWR